MYVQINGIDRNIYMISSVVIDGTKVIYKMINGVQLQEEFSSTSEATAKYEEVIAMTGGGGTSDYEELNNIPSINGTTLIGNLSLADIGVGNVFTIKGSIATPEDLPASDNVIGDVYYVESVMAGYVWIEDDGTERWEELGEPIDLSNYQEKLQFSSMPTASSSNEGLIVQFIGTTDSTYTNGYFYKCVSDGAVTPTYSWEAVNVQAGGSGNQEVFKFTYSEASATSIATAQAIIDYYNDKGAFPAIQYKFYDAYFPVYFSELKTSYNTWYFNIYKYEDNGNQYYGTPRMVYLGNIEFVYTTDQNTITSVSLPDQNDSNTMWRTFRPLAPYGTYGLMSSSYVSNDYKYGCMALSVSNSESFTPAAGSYNPATAVYAESMLEAIAPAYDNTATYSVGDYVTRRGKLYVCNTAISVAEDWTVAHWTQTTVAGIIGNLNTVLASLTTPNNGGN